MNPTLKKILAAVAIKQVYDRVRAARRPKPSPARRMMPLALVAAAAGGVAALARSGRLEPLAHKARAALTSSEGGGSA